MPNQVLKTINLSIGFSKRKSPLFSDLNLTCRSSEIIGLVGRNGIGKSTLLKSLAGLLAPIHGEVRIKDKNIKKINRNDLAKSISYVSTEIPHISHITVFDLAAYGRFPYTGWMGSLDDRDIEIVKRSIRNVGIEYISDKPIDEISDGERQRAMIARALAQDTEVIILDEPTAFLDLPNRYGILRLLNEMAKNNDKTVIFSTHDLGIAMQEVDIIWLLQENEIITGAPEDLALNNKYFKIFENSQLEFDIRKGEIRLKRNSDKVIGLKGEGIPKYWTERALERTGFKVVKNFEEKFVSILNTDNKTRWLLNEKDKMNEFKTIYELLLYLK